LCTDQFVWPTVPCMPLDCAWLSLQLLLTKLRPGPLLLEDIPKNVSISSVSHSRISSLYHALKNVYTPLLGDNDGSELSESNSQLQGLVKQLEAGLRSSLRQGRQVTLHIAAKLLGTPPPPSPQPTWQFAFLPYFQVSTLTDECCRRLPRSKIMQRSLLSPIMHHCQPFCDQKMNFSCGLTWLPAQPVQQACSKEQHP
jgi:hypothetical protein